MQRANRNGSSLEGPGTETGDWPPGEQGRQVQWDPADLPPGGRRSCRQRSLGTSKVKLRGGARGQGHFAAEMALVPSTRGDSGTFPFGSCAINADDSSVTELDKNETDQRLSYFSSRETL